MNYEKIKYPDGQISVKILNYSLSRVAERINSYEDLFLIKSISTFMKEFHTDVELFFPCLFGQRSDRKFADNQSFDLELIADFINSCGFSSVEIFDPHSYVGPALIKNRSVRTSFEFVQRAITELITKGASDIVLVSPDAGAYKKVFEYGEKLSMEVMGAVKHRSKEGKVSLKFVGNVKDRDCLIVDDLCDGGYTFYLLSKALREQGAKSVYLYVSHGIFSKGFYTPLESTDINSSLLLSLDGIFCTNSVKDIVFNDESKLKHWFTQFKVI